jgi:tetratricopeptide (TPR) repeat protein
VALGLVAVLAIAVQLPALISLSRVRVSQRDFRHGRIEAARNAAQEAVDAEPWAATPYVQRGLLEEAAGNLPRAAADILRAERAEPRNWRHPLLLARILAEQDDPGGAIAAYRRARALRPLSPVFKGP